jgi:hypothetical protein
MVDARSQFGSIFRSIPSSMGPPALYGWLLFIAFRGWGFDARVAQGWTGTVLAGTGAGLIILLHILIPWDPNQRFISEYARDHKFGFLMDWAFACLGFASIVLGSALATTFPTSNLPWVLRGAGVLICLLSIFVCDSSTRRRGIIAAGQTPSPEGAWHDRFTAVAFVAYILAMLWFTFDPGFQLSGRSAFLGTASFSLFNVSLLCAIGYVVMGIRSPASPETPTRPIGLAERAVILCLFEWVGIVSGVILTAGK